LSVAGKCRFDYTALHAERALREIEKISAVLAFSAVKNSEVRSTTPDGETIRRGV
jgi:hypothetical protein